MKTLLVILIAMVIAAYGFVLGAYVIPSIQQDVQRVMETARAVEDR